MLEHKWIGERRVEDWFSRLPGDDISDEQLVQLGCFETVANVKWRTKQVMYGPFCSSFEPLLKLAGDAYIVLVTRDHPEIGMDKRDVRSALSMYRKDGPGQAAYALQAEQLAEDATQEPVEDKATPREYLGRTAWAWMTASIAIKASPTDSPFVHRPGPIKLNRTDAGERVRAQLAECAAELLLRQHRTFVFTAVIVRDLAWLMRWDRAGVIVSPGFNYIKHPRHLFTFIYRIATASLECQGYDTKATLVDEESSFLLDFKVYREKKKQENKKWHHYYADQILGSTKFYPIYQIKCPDVPWLKEYHRPRVSPSGRTYTYLIGKHLAGNYNPVGRGGKGFIAYDVDRRQLAFIKDYWRAERATMHPELDTYEKLNKREVKHVATVIAGGDVDGPQTTVADELLLHRSNHASSGRSAKRFHHRLVMLEIGRPLETHEKGRHLFRAIYDALIAHHQAYTKCQILHRDVSMGNILIDIDANGIRGFLNDWDMCRYLSEQDCGLSQDGQTGTWPYMSGILVRCPKKPNELSDDLESFVYVLEVACLRFRRHNLALPEAQLEAVNMRSTSRASELAAYYSIKFDLTHDRPGGFSVGHSTKVEHMLAGKPGALELKDDSSNLGGLLRELYKLGQEHYSQINLSEYYEKWGSPVDNSSAAVGTKRSAPQSSSEDDASDYDGSRLLKTPSARRRRLRPKPVDTTRVMVPPDGPDRLGTFNTHEDILDTFSEFHKLEWTDGLAQPDQFADLWLLDYACTAGPVGGSTASRVLSGTSISSRPRKRRKPDGSSDASFESASSSASASSALSRGSSRRE